MEDEASGPSGQAQVDEEPIPPAGVTTIRRVLAEVEPSRHFQPEPDPRRVAREVELVLGEQLKIVRLRMEIAVVPTEIDVLADPPRGCNLDANGPDVADVRGAPPLVRARADPVDDARVPSAEYGQRPVPAGARAEVEADIAQFITEDLKAEAEKLVKDEQVTDYYEETPAEYKKRVDLRVSQILVKVSM